jgi:hypothetical protein
MLANNDRKNMVRFKKALKRVLLEHVRGVDGWGIQDVEFIGHPSETGMDLVSVKLNDGTEYLVTIKQAAGKVG